MSTPAALSDLASERFVELTTFRRTGAPVRTAVWIAADRDELIVTTPAGSGKVKRLRHDSRVELRPSDRRGRVDEGAPLLRARARIVEKDGEVQRCGEIFRRKYGFEYVLFLAIERLARSGRTRRVILRLR